VIAPSVTNPKLQAMDGRWRSSDAPLHAAEQRAMVFGYLLPKQKVPRWPQASETAFDEVACAPPAPAP
jgi:hypothetical protein